MTNASFNVYLKFAQQHFTLQSARNYQWSHRQMVTQDVPITQEYVALM